MSGINPSIRLTPPGEKVLLHACCAPCCGAILECMAQNGMRPVVFFSNSNISTREEYDKRLAELKRYCDALGMELFDDVYDHGDWLDFVLDRERGTEERSKGLASMPERQERCLRCFKYRLRRAVKAASELGCDTLTTSLASSRWKSLEQVDEAGKESCGNRESVVWWAQNWRKGGLQPRRSEIIREQGFYNQTFCGCEFSQKDNTDE